jgi:hypothetical protein
MPALFMMSREYDGVVVDFSRQRVTNETLAKLFALAKVCIH